MFVTTQPWQKPEDYESLMQDLRPPPPPGDENVWELHFCKWWGWNWVMRKEAVESPIQRPVETSQQNPPQNTLPPPPNKSGQKNKQENKVEKKPEKKPIKNLCRTLCFKNSRKQQKPLQKMYNTPSNSVIEENDSKNDKGVSTVQKVYSPPIIIKPQTDQRNSSIQKEIEEIVTKESRSQVYASKVDTHKKKRIRKESSTSFSEECSCCCCGERSESSGDGCVEYINISCCPCCHLKEPSITKKQLSENYTQPTLPSNKMISTQTERKEKEKKHRRRRICVVCCSCGQSLPRCCSCNKNGREEIKFDKHRGVQAVSDDLDAAQFYKGEHKNERGYSSYSPTYNVTTDPSSPFTKKNLQPTSTLNKKFAPLYRTGLPLDLLLLGDYNKPITKFGIPSQNYSWIHATKSDIWDQLLQLKGSRQFSSPISGNTYNISPQKIDNADRCPSVLLNPLSVDEELRSLKKIESEVKMDLKSRIMLDAVCDAILSKDKGLSRNSSIFLNELTYSSNITQTESTLNGLYKSENVNKNTKSNRAQTLEKLIFEDVKTCNENKINHNNTAEDNLKMSSQENKSPSSEFMRVRSPRTYSIENSFMRATPDTSFSLNYNSSENKFQTIKENKAPFKAADLVIKTNPSLSSAIGQATFSRTGLMSAFKRSAPPPIGENVKKAKLREPASLMPVENRNIKDIFKKIDEIVLRSKANNDEIQNVLKTIPKKTFQFLTSCEVSTLTNQNNTPIHITEQGVSSSSVNTVVEESKNQKGKTKIPAAKKKKTVGRPSLIPKRVADAKLNKKMS